MCYLEGAMQRMQSKALVRIHPGGVTRPDVLQGFAAVDGVEGGDGELANGCATGSSTPTLRLMSHLDIFQITQTIHVVPISEVSVHENNFDRFDP